MSSTPDGWETGLIGGPETRTITIVAYRPEWPLQFRRHAARIADALGDTARRIEHIGSTAVEGLAAKPIVDMLVFVFDTEIPENRFSISSRKPLDTVSQIAIVSSMASLETEKVQIIADSDGRPTHAVIPWETWTAIAAVIGSDDLYRASPEAPAYVTKRLASGDNPVKVYREYRRMTQAQLASLVGSTSAYVSQIENGSRRPGKDLLRLIARALNVEYGDIVLPSLPTVKDIANYPVRWNASREIVSCMLSVDSEPLLVAVSREALEDLERSDGLTRQQALKAFERHRTRIRNAAARAVAERRRPRDGVTLLVTADF